MKSVLRFLIGLYLINTSILLSQIEEARVVSNTFKPITSMKDSILIFNEKDSTSNITSNIEIINETQSYDASSNNTETIWFSPIYSLLPNLLDPFPPTIKSINFKSNNTFWNGLVAGKVVPNVNATKKIRKIKRNHKAGLNQNTIIIYNKYDETNLQIPAIFSVEWYRKKALKENFKNKFRENFIKNITKKSKGLGGKGKGLNLINTQIGDTDVELNITGNISVDGALVFENKDLVTTNLRESKSWDLEIEQTQRFNIDGNIGDKFFVKIKQDSEADFTWENDLTIEYRGDKNNILQKAEAGNINLSLEGMDAVSMGGANSSLFGIKAVSQLGPIEIQSVIAREQVKKSEKTYEGGAEDGGSTTINDYNFIKDRYFFIDEIFRNNFYPLNESKQHIYNPNRVIGEYELYQKVTSTESASLIQADAYLDPNDLSSYSVGGTWEKLEEDSDYSINRLLGYIRLSAVQNAIAISFTTTTFDQINQSFSSIQDSTNGTNFKSTYDNCVSNNPDSYQDDCGGLITLKLLKDISASTPNSPTWPLMFKNVYSIGSSNIDPTGLEIEILKDEGAGNQFTHSESGVSYLSIFGLDEEDENHQKVEGGDGKIDLYGSFLNLAYGELILPTYLPFSYDNKPRKDTFGNPLLTQNNNSTYWGNNALDLQGIFETPLNDENGNFSDIEDSGPAMYYSTNDNEINSQHEFIINIKTTSRNTSMSLGFMIVEGSETVRMGNRILQKDIDYTIDYFSGTINFISQEALDPTAEISISYEENEFISFDQKLLVGSHFKYNFGNKNYLAGGMFYYNQSIADEKVDVGYEPMRNFVWNIKGKYQNDFKTITKAIDYLPFIETTKPSNFSIEGNYAEINPNPNPLGQAFIDDFESAKRTSSISIMQRQWKIASPPIDSSQTIKNRGNMIWYNPYEDELTSNIWPEQSTSTRANNNTTKTLNIQSNFQIDSKDSLAWNGIMIPLYSSEHDQSLSKYMDIWLNANDILENSVDDSFKMHIDIGYISEDLNENGILDTEDEPVYGPGMGDGILADGEDIGVDNCTNSYEDGWGGCLCKNYDNEIYNSDLDGIYNQENEFCLNGIKYSEALQLLDQYPDTVRYPLFDFNGNQDDDYLDPNRDNWCYNTSGCNNTNNYSKANGTEGNGLAMGYRYPDTEDLDKNNSLDSQNNYFTFTIIPKLPTDHPESMVITQSMDGESPTGWKLIRIPLSSFYKVGSPTWNDVPSVRIRIESSISQNQTLKIAKMELVENDWQEMGTILKENLSDQNMFIDDPFFSVSVINTDESSEYKNSLNNLDIVLEHDEYNDIDIKEQSLVLSFDKNPDYNLSEADSLKGGINPNHAVLIENTFPSLGADKAQSYFAYENMKMYVHGGDPSSTEICSWCSNDSSNVELLFRIGKDHNNYYEIYQPIYKGWDKKNHLNINIDRLTQLKIPTIDSPAEELADVGLDGCNDATENGFGGCLDTLTFTYFCKNEDSLSFDVINTYIDSSICNNFLENELIQTDWDPNADNWLDCGSDGICDQIDFDNTEQNGVWDKNEGMENNNIYDQIDTNEDGIISMGEGEPAIEDYNGDAIYNPHPDYNYENEYYFWNEKSIVSNICNNCTKLHIKGSPSINNIQSIVMGVINNSDDWIYGKILVNELRMSGVKKRKGRSYSVNGSLELADLMTISGSYNKKQSDFHKLQQRLGTGNSDESYSTTIKINPNIILPARLGIKTPISLGYNRSISTPKYLPGSDIITNSESNKIDLTEIQTISEKISFSTSFNKSTRSTNWLLKRTLDNLTVNYSAIRNTKSTNQIFGETKDNFTASAGYAYTFGKDNYLNLFSFAKNWIIVGDILGDSRYYYTPDKLSANINFSENNSWKIMRINQEDTTKSYSFNMKRKFAINHKFTKTLTSNYSKQIDSNLDDYRYNKIDIINHMATGLVKASNEKLTNTYSPDFMKWLKPTISYNPNYSWNLNIIDTVTTANVKSSSSLKAKIGFSFKELIELIYTPDNKKTTSSRGRGRSRSNTSRSSKNSSKINIKNPIARFILSKFHLLSSKLNTINSTYTYTTSHDYNNINSDQNISYLYRLGIKKNPVDNYESLFNDDIINNNNLVNSQSSSYGNDLTISSSVNVTRSIVTSLDFKYSNALSVPSTSSRTKNETLTFYPIGNRGDEGFPISNWSINWSGIEKWWIMDKFFKTISLSHGFNGEKSLTSKDENNDGIISDNEIQNEQFSYNFSPIIGITTKTIGRSPITFKINYNHNQNIKKIDESTERNHNSQISSSLSFRKSGGLTIPIFFFRDFYIDNDIDFAINFNWDTNQKLMTSRVVADLEDFNEQSNNISWSIKPNVTYSFTRWVNGNFYFVYGVTENKTTGRNEEKDFGFSMNIKIQG